MFSGRSKGTLGSKGLMFRSDFRKKGVCSKSATKMLYREQVFGK